MIKGLYTAAAGMLTTARDLDITTNNLSNVNTDGYKKDDGIKESFPEILFNRISGNQREKRLGSITTGVHLAEDYTDFSGGNLRHTGNQLDVAIDGRGMFVVQTPAGERYTRNGNFTLNNDNQLVTQQGYPVLNRDGNPVEIDITGEVQIDRTGRILVANQLIDNLQIAEAAEETELTKMGENLFIAEEDADIQPAEDFELLQRHLEGSNVDVVEEMVKVIKSNRHYEANQKVASAVDETLERTVNNVGRLG